MDDKEKTMGELDRQISACETEEKHVHSKYSIGLRTIKTALAVFVCLLIHYIFGTETGFYSCIAGLFA